MKPRLSEAVILMAGCGSRLRGADQTFLKPLVPVLGRPLVSYTLETLAQAGIRKITAVIGFEAHRLGPTLKTVVPAGVALQLIENTEWEKQNGISALAAQGKVTAPFLLTMSDHLFDRGMVDVLIERADTSLLNLATDSKLSSFFDLNDAMKVRTRDGYVIEIGKTLSNYDAIDTGLFLCPEEIFDYLGDAKKDGDCALADGVRLMASDGKVRAIDIGEVWWQDVDTPEMLKHAEGFLRARSADHLGAAAAAPHRHNRER